MTRTFFAAPLFVFALFVHTAFACTGTAVPTAANCGANNGAITTTVTEGTAPFAYAWSHDGTLQSSKATGLAAGNYSVTITDAVGCAFTLTTDITTVVGGTLPAITPKIVKDTCGSGRGWVKLKVNGGTTPYTYQWNDPLAQTTDSASMLKEGTYRVVVKGADGCQDSAIIILTSHILFNFAASIITPVRCFEESNGEVKIVIAKPYTTNPTYTWPTRTEVIGNIVGLKKGVYNCQVADGTCLDTVTAIVNEPALLLPNITIVAEPTCGNADGKMVMTPTGGNPPYSYSWGTLAPQTTDTAFSVPPGKFNFEVSDTKGCQFGTFYILSSKNAPALSIDVLLPDNCGLNQGVMRVNIEGGRWPFVYEWRNRNVLLPDTIDFVYNLANGEFYDAVVVDADSCVSRVESQMTGNKRLKIATFSTIPDYCQLANGSATGIVDPSTGAEPYTYDWNTTPFQRGIDNITAEGLEAGKYRLKVIDKNNCKDSVYFEIFPTPGYVPTVTTAPSTCGNTANGQMIVSPNGGQGTVIYTWNNVLFGTTGSRSDLIKGIYAVTMIDDSGCTRSVSAEVAGPPPLLPEFTSFPDTTMLIPQNTGVAFTNLTQGAENYIWDFGNGDSSFLVSPVYSFPDSGKYDVTLTAINNGGLCARDTTIKHYHIIATSTAFMPTAFSPNGDKLNDTYQVKVEELFSYDLKIFDRWGALIYEGIDPENPWDGTVDGSPAPEGGYVFFLRAVGYDKVIHQETGSFQLLR